MKKITELTDAQLNNLIDNRWNSSQSVWDIVNQTYDQNLKAYKNQPDWLQNLPRKKSKVRANRIFVNTEAVINSVIANPPRPTVLPTRGTPESKSLAISIEKFLGLKYLERNVKEVMRKGLRNLYFSRLIVLKPFWNSKINDFDVKAVKPTDIRISKNATKEDDSEFIIEEIEDNIAAVIARFPNKKLEILKKYGYENDEDILVENKDVKYKEAWCWDYVIFQMGNIILGKIRNPYWDWDGVKLTEDEAQMLGMVQNIEERKNVLSQAKMENDSRMAVMENNTEGITYSSFYYNHFDHPRKPYIFATILNNENTPIGQTDMISQAIPLQEDVDEAKRDISENRKFVNGILKVDSSVMTQGEAKKIGFDVAGVIWGKGVANGVVRETGTALPGFVMESMLDSRREIDNIMAASSAFKGQREGQETRGGRLALIDQSFLLLNELTQVVDYVNFELFNWFMQLMKTRYTEHHYAKTVGKNDANEQITLMQDDFEDGIEVRIISGKSLPEDRQFKFEQAQKDIQAGVISPVDYFEAAGYDNPGEKAKNRVLYDLNKPKAVGISDEEMQQLVPEKQPEEVPKTSIKYEELPPDGKVQLAAKAGINLDPQIVVQEEMKKQRDIEIEKERKMDFDNRSIEMKNKSKSQEDEE